jgi:hypothetical protein
VSELTKNVSGNEHCGYCCGSEGFVFVGWSKVGTDEMGPCPYCEAGERAEWGSDGRRRWRNGYWQGRPATGVERACQCQIMHLSRDENKARLRELAARIGREMA